MAKKKSQMTNLNTIGNSNDQPNIYIEYIKQFYEVNKYYHFIINQIEYDNWSSGTLPDILSENKYYETILISKEHSPPETDKPYDNYHYHILVRRISAVQTMKDNFKKHIGKFSFKNHKCSVVKNFDHILNIIPYILKDGLILYYKDDILPPIEAVPKYSKPSEGTKADKSKQKMKMIKYINEQLNIRKQNGKKIKYIGILKMMVQWYMDNTPEYKAWSISNLKNLADRVMISHTENGIDKYLAHTNNIWDD